MKKLCAIVITLLTCGMGVARLHACDMELFHSHGESQLNDLHAKHEEPRHPTVTIHCSKFKSDLAMIGASSNIRHRAKHKHVLRAQNAAPAVLTGQFDGMSRPNLRLCPHSFQKAALPLNVLLSVLQI